MISGSSVLLDLPRSQRNGAPRRLRCRRACGSTRGLCSSAGVRTPDSGHTDSLVRLDNNRFPLSRWDDLFYFAERVSNKISSSGQRRGRRRSAVNHFRVKALGRTQPPGPKPLVGHLRTPILGVFFLWRLCPLLGRCGGACFRVSRLKWATHTHSPCLVKELRGPCSPLYPSCNSLEGHWLSVSLLC